MNYTTCCNNVKEPVSAGRVTEYSLSWWYCDSYSSLFSFIVQNMSKIEVALISKLILLVIKIESSKMKNTSMVRKRIPLRWWQRLNQCNWWKKMNCAKIILYGNNYYNNKIYSMCNIRTEPRRTRDSTRNSTVFLRVILFPSIRPRFAILP